MSSAIDPRKQFSRLLDKATRILALRDHSESELRSKLTQSAERAALRDKDVPSISEEMLDEVVRWCQEQGWQNDERFTERFIASRSRKGFGPQRIRMELAQRGIARERIEDAFFQTEIDWLQCTEAAAAKKFGLPLSVSWPEKAKIQRYLISKGFLSEDIREIFRNFAD